MDPNTLETEVISLLELQGWAVERERLVGHKKVDSLATKSDDFGIPQRVAVEAKSGKSGCTRADVSSIYADYLPLVEARLVDSILLVTEGTLAPTATTYVAESPNIRHLAYAQLLNRVIDFSQYAAGLRTQFEDNQLVQRYVPQNYGEGTELLEEHVLDWAASTDSRPIAILGGYGLGKSTLARRLASKFAAEYESDPNSRIPILIQLSYLATDQHLEGLLGRLFTTNSVVHNYNYDLFLALNRRGRFLILLDGFDEMKRTMSWDALRYNLGQLHQLIHENSKVVLLGRPTAFVSQAEHDEALHGLRTINRQERRLPDWPDYRELSISTFTREQVKTYLQKVLESITPDSADDENADEHRHKLQRYLNRIEGAEGRRLVELVCRPVQLKMLVEILPGYDGDLSNMTVALLYEEFIDLVIRRELDKDSRRAFDVRARRRFAGKLAFYLWEDDQKSEIDAEKLSDEFFREFAKSDEDDLAAIRRDLLSGCFLEKKPPNSFYFPHRSFQEYLVADRLATIASGGRGEMSDCPYLTDEILSFFVELMGRKKILMWRKNVENYQPSLNSNARTLLKTACAFVGIKDPFQKKSSTDADEDDRISDEERQALLSRLLIGDIVSTAEQGNEKKQKKGQAKTPHKRSGVTRKKDFFG